MPDDVSTNDFTRSALRLLTGLLVGATACFATACSSHGKSNSSSPISAAAAGSGGSVMATAAGAAGSGGAASSALPHAGASGMEMSAAAGGSSGSSTSAAGMSGASGSSTAPAAGAGEAGGQPATGASGAPGTGAGGMAGGGGAMNQCDKIPPSSADCAQALAPGDARKCMMTVSLNERSYYLYAPPTYDPCKPTALIIDCHGAAETAEAQAGIVTLHTADTTNGPLDYPGIGSGWRLEADTPGGGFIVVTPQGIDNIWTSLNDDTQFFLDIVAATNKIANIDPAKVYMTGISNGSLISYETVCPHTDVFSGIAAFSTGEDCSSVGKPIPVISFDASPDFAYSTTVSASDTMVTLDQCKAAVDPKWLTIDSNTTDTVCRNDPFDTHPTLVPCNTITKTSITTSGIEPTVCKRWDDCNGGVAVVFCDVAPSTLHGPDNAAVDAHILYGNATSLNMPSVAWRFFKSFWK